jgi:hypothetical protein
VGVGVAVGHGIDDQHDVVAVVIGAASRRFNPEAGCDTRDEDLRVILASWPCKYNFLLWIAGAFWRINRL